MTSNYEDEFYDRFLSPSELEEGEADCFEILSAYIDGEATVAERKQVQDWLDNDPEIKQTYLQLLKLQGGMQNLAVPSPIPADELAQKVFAQVDRRSDRRRTFVWGSAIAAAIVGAVLTIIPNGSAPSLRFADSESPATNQNKTVKVAVSLNKPTVIIPKAAVANPPKVRKI